MSIIRSLRDTAHNAATMWERADRPSVNDDKTCTVCGGDGFTLVGIAEVWEDTDPDNDLGWQVDLIAAVWECDDCSTEHADPNTEDYD